jgi:hypothetical protein
MGTLCLIAGWGSSWLEKHQQGKNYSGRAIKTYDSVQTAKNGIEESKQTSR